MSNEIAALLFIASIVVVLFDKIGLIVLYKTNYEKHKSMRFKHGHQKLPIGLYFAFVIVMFWQYIS